MVMASNVRAHRALTAGLSAGACLAIPAAAFAATIPFEDVHVTVGAAAMPFAIGSLAGMGVLAATARLVSAHEEQLDQAAEHVEAAARKRSENARAARREGVPVISRAVDALSEEEAWAEIDSLLDSDLSVSCDPIHSKDLYQIALEEMARDARENATVRADADIRSAGVVNTEPESAQVFAALSDTTSVMDIPAIPMQNASIPRADAAATASLGSSLQQEPHEEDEGAEVPMVDYSGHEDMWAAALAILSEDTADESGSILEMSSSRVESEAGSTAPVSQERCRAMAEGAHSTGLHTRVNEILEEELDKVSSQSVRTCSREYLRVIQGGTMAMPRLTAQQA